MCPGKEEWESIPAKKRKKLGRKPCGMEKQQTTQYLPEHKSWSPVGSDEAWRLAHTGPE